MQIGTSYSLSGVATSGGGTTLYEVGGQLVSAPNFGPATQVSLSTVGVSFTGFQDYTSALTKGQWQFNLSGVLNVSTSGVPEQAVSEEQAKAEAEAVEYAFELMNAGNTAGARDLIGQVLDENKTNAAAVHTLGYAELTDRNYEAAEQMFLKAHALNPTVGYDRDARNARILQGSDQEVLERAQAFVRTPTEREEGVRILIELTKRNDSFAEAHLALGDAMLDQGDGDNGLMQYNAAINTANSGLLGTIETKLRELLEDAPDAVFVRQLVGKVQISQERYEDAVQTLTAAAQLTDSPLMVNRDLARAYVGLGRERLEHNDVTRGLSLFFKAKELDPTGYDTKQALAEGHIARAEQHTRRRDYSAALDDYRSAETAMGAGGRVRLKEQAAHGAYAIALSAQRKRIANGEDIDMEVVAFQLAHDFDPDEKKYKKSLAEVRFELGAQYELEGKLKEAADAYNKAYRLYENNETYRDKAIAAYVAYADDRLYNLNYDDAISAYLTAFEIDTDNGATKQKLADAYNARGENYLTELEHKKALMDFKSALRLFPTNPAYLANYDKVKGWDF